MTEKRLGGNIGSQATKNTRIKMASLFFGFFSGFLLTTFYKGGAYSESGKKIKIFCDDGIIFSSCPLHYFVVDCSAKYK